jgi:hypothetical protein
MDGTELSPTDIRSEAVTFTNTKRHGGVQQETGRGNVVVVDHGNGFL